MSNPTFGLSFEKVDDEPRPLFKSDMSVIGLVVTAPQAQEQRYPINTPVELMSNDREAVMALGNAGTVKNQISAINAQLGDLQSAAKIVIIRVNEGTTEAETMNNLIEGISFLPDAGPSLGVMPRLISVPNYTHQINNGDGNPVVAALPSVLDNMLAHAVVTGPHNTKQAFIDWRETLKHQRLIPVETWIKYGSNAEIIDSAPSILGVGVRRDQEKNGRPFHSWANQQIQGIIGPNRNMRFSLTDGATEGQDILSHNGGIILRGEAGIETAIASGGFVFVGTDNAGEDDLWRFYNVTRGRDYINLMFLRTLRFYLGRFNLTGQTIQAIINTMNIGLRDLKADNDILGYNVGISHDQNSPEELRLGRITVEYMAEEAPVLRYIGIRHARYRKAIDDLLSSLIAQMDRTYTG